MISLFLDTSSSKFIVGIYKETEELYLKIEDNNNDLSRKCLKYIKEACDTIDIKLKNIDNIYVVNGPGSFTGIRIGVTIAKTIAWGFKKNIYTISELQLLSTTNTNKKYIVPIIDARRGFVYGAMYDYNLNPIIDNEYICLEKLINKVKRRVSLSDVEFVSYDKFDFSNINIPKLNISEIIEKHRGVQPISPHLVNPNYLKKTEAEEKLHG